MSTRIVFYVLPHPRNIGIVGLFAAKFVVYVVLRLIILL